jgi:hypothetical protein
MNKDTLEDLMRDCPCDSQKWCFLREVVKHSGISDRTAEQIRLVYTHKFLLSLQSGQDVGEKVAWGSWVEKGYAARFAEIYQEGMKHEELKYKMFLEK